jgi:hypothetical protein
MSEPKTLRCEMPVLMCELLERGVTLALTVDANKFLRIAYNYVDPKHGPVVRGVISEPKTWHPKSNGANVHLFTQLLGDILEEVCERRDEERSPT